MRKAPSQKPSPPILTKDELHERLVEGDDLQLVNVLDPRHYGLGMIRNSLKIPYAALSKRWKELDKSREVVAYCSDPSSDRSRMAAELLLAKGFRASWYDGGIREWMAAGLPADD